MALPPTSASPLRLNLIFNAKPRTGQVTKQPPFEVTNSGQFFVHKFHGQRV